MKFFAIVCTLVIISIYTAEAMWYDSDESKVHETRVIGCQGRRMQLNNQMKQVMCVPRPSLVQLVPQPGYTFFPNYVSVKRCGGFCPRKKSCMSVQTEMKKIAVQMESYISKECYHVLVEEHIKCKCQCNVKESHCNALQVYNENNCACECVNKVPCNKARQMVWSEKLCKCMCNKEEICSSGLEWVPSLCGCAKVEMPTSDVDISNIRK